MAQDRPPTPTPRKHRLVILWAVIALCGALIVMQSGQFRQKWQAAQRQWRAVQTIERLGGQVSRVHDFDTLPEWMRRQFPLQIHAVDLSGTAATNDHVTCLAEFPGTTRVNLSSTKIGPGGLAPLACLQELESLQLDHTHVTDQDLSYLAILRLRDLSLSQTGITVAGLKQLGAQPALDLLDLRGTGVRDADLGVLAAFAQLRQVFVDEAQVTALGGSQLKGIATLKNVIVRIESGTGKAAFEALVQSGLQGSGVDRRTAAVLWNSEASWLDTIAGVAEVIQQDIHGASVHPDQLDRAICVAFAGHDFPGPRLADAVNRPSSIPGQNVQPTRELSCEEFLELSESKVAENLHDLVAFTQSDLPESAVTQLIVALEPFANMPADSHVRITRFQQQHMITSALVQQGADNERIASALARLLNSPNPWVRDTAVHSLDPLYRGRLLYGQGDRLFDTDWTPDKAHVAAVVKLLSGMTTDSNWEVRGGVASALSQAVEVDPSHAKAVLPLLLEMLDDPIPPVIPTLLSSIKRAADADNTAARSAVPRLLKKFATATPLNKAAITEALGSVACQDLDDARQAAELSLPLLRDADRSLQAAACRVLSLVAERQPGALGFVVPAVVQMLNDLEDEIRTVAKEALRSIAEGVHTRCGRSSTVLP